MYFRMSADDKSFDKLWVYKINLLCHNFIFEIISFGI